MNDDKTELLLIGSNYECSKITNISIKIGNTVVTPENSAKNLGIVFDKNLSLNEHINQICKKSFFQLKRISQLRNYMSEDTTIIMIHSFLHSNLDYRNSLFNNLPKYLINKLQKIQNTAERIIKHKNKFDNITPVLKDLHWLTIERKSIFKIAVLTYKTLNGYAPQYLNDIIHKHTSVRTLRSTNRN